MTEVERLQTVKSSNQEAGRDQLAKNTQRQLDRLSQPQGVPPTPAPPKDFKSPSVVTSEPFNNKKTEVQNELKQYAKPIVGEGRMTRVSYNKDTGVTTRAETRGGKTTTSVTGGKQETPERPQEPSSQTSPQSTPQVDAFGVSQDQYDQVNKPLDEELDFINSAFEGMKETRDAALQNQIARIQAMYQQRREEQRRLNDAILATQTQAGIRSGRNRYAAEIQSGILSEIEQDNLSKIQALDSEEQQLIEAAQIANNEENFAAMIKNFEMARQVRMDKQQAIKDLRDAAVQQNSLILEKARAAREELRFQQEVREYERKVMLEDTGMIAGNLIEVEEVLMEDGTTTFNLIPPPPEQIQAIADELGISAGYLSSAVKKQYQELSKMTDDQVKRELEIMKIQKDLKEEKMSIERSDYERALRNGEFEGGFFDWLSEKSKASASGTAMRKTGGAGDITLSEPVEKAIFNAVTRLRLPSQAKADAVADVKRFLANGDVEGAKEALGVYIRNSADVQTGRVVDKKDLSVSALERLQEKLDEFEKADGDTGLFAGLSEDALQRLGTTRGTGKLAELKNDIALAIIDYRQAVSGAAFTPEEGNEYKKIFPSIGNVPELNKVKINSLIEKFRSDIETFNMQRIGRDTYETIFGDEMSYQPPRDFKSDLMTLGNIQPILQSQITSLLGEVNEETGEPFTYEEIWKIVDGDSYSLEPTEWKWKYGPNGVPIKSFNPVGGDTNQALEDWTGGSGKLEHNKKSLISSAFSSIIPRAKAAEPVITREDVEVYESRNGRPISAPTAILDGMKVITEQVAPNLAKFAGNCVFYARSIVPNIPTNAVSVAGRKEGIKKAVEGGFGGYDSTKARVGDAIHTSEGNVGHSAVIIGETPTHFILEEANYKPGQITKGRQIAKNDPKILGWIRPKGGVNYENKKNEGRNEGIEEEVMKIARKSPVFKSYYYKS